MRLFFSDYQKLLLEEINAPYHIDNEYVRCEDLGVLQDCLEDYTINYAQSDDPMEVEKARELQYMISIVVKLSDVLFDYEKSQLSVATS